MQLLNSIFSLEKFSGPHRSLYRSHHAYKYQTILCEAFPFICIENLNMENSEVNSKS